MYLLARKSFIEMVYVLLICLLLLISKKCFFRSSRLKKIRKIKKLKKILNTRNCYCCCCWSPCAVLQFELPDALCQTLAHGAKSKIHKAEFKKCCVIFESHNKDIRKASEPAIMSAGGSHVYV